MNVQEALRSVDNQHFFTALIFGHVDSIRDVFQLFDRHEQTIDIKRFCQTAHPSNAVIPLQDLYKGQLLLEHLIHGMGVHASTLKEEYFNADVNTRRGMHLALGVYSVSGITVLCHFRKMT